MVRLSQILGSILKDIAQARVTSDALSAETLKQYRSNDLLKHFPVPRVTMKEASVDLQFAVVSHQRDEFKEQEIIELGRAWFQHLERVLLPSIIPGMPVGTSALTAGFLVRRAEDERFKAIGSGSRDQVIESSIELLGMAWRSSAVGRLVPFAKVEPRARSRMRSIYDRDISKLRQMTIARLATNLDLDVMIQSDELANSTEVVRQQIHLVLAEEDLEGFTVDPIDEEYLEEEIPPPPWELRQVKEVQGIGDAFAMRLAKVGVRSYGDLMEWDPTDLSKKTGLSTTHIRKWQSKADLERLGSIDDKWAELLVRCGVQDRLDLAQKTPEALLREIEAYVGSVNVPRFDRFVDAKLVRFWVAEARRSVQAGDR